MAEAVGFSVGDVRRLEAEWADEEAYPWDCDFARSVRDWLAAGLDGPDVLVSGDACYGDVERVVVDQERFMAMERASGSDGAGLWAWGVDRGLVYFADPRDMRLVDERAMALVCTPAWNRWLLGYREDLSALQAAAGC